MGVPALFRWLSKKYPKIVTHVAEDKPQITTDADGNEYLFPVDITTPNPNGFEMDNLYLDMNGIVHPCTHPEGKPAPATEQEMMLEIFLYTERIVNMIRPRKLLFMAIDGVAPRAKMNQQRSRRFRTARENKEKEEQRLEGIALFEAMGKTVSEDTKNVKTWDSNAITPGTPFMTLLASSLRYWVAKKLNTDPGWKHLEVIISDASVPGEGEHKIMDFIRRQRISPAHDPNTKHVIYGLDADLIMLALATHEPHFRVLREDVFAQDANKGCRICGQEGHFAAQCTVDKSTLKDPVEKIDKPLADSKPFIFLDISILREYLEFELDIPAVPFQFDFERAIDDWVLLIFFVGNDFLPHLPSLEIREGAIDMLVNIWKDELHRMKGYVTNHGQIELPRLQVIMDALARREDGIFRRRREHEERQEQNAKRRKVEQMYGPSGSTGHTGTPNNGANESIPGLTFHPPIIHSSKSDLKLPNKPDFGTLVASTPALGLQPEINRTSIRKANLQALQALKGEIASTPSSVTVESTALEVTQTTVRVHNLDQEMPLEEATNNRPTLTRQEGSDQDGEEAMSIEGQDSIPVPSELPEDGVPLKDSSIESSAAVPQGETASRGIKRKLDEMEAEEEASVEEEEEQDAGPLPLKVNPDGTVDQVDTVRLWEPGYKERYYKQKFKGDVNDNGLRRKIVKHYVEGLMWVLHYYYQGAPSWQWFYPYHFAPFASDFEDIQSLDIRFEKGEPFKPFVQLMGVFPPASRQHIPLPMQDLMVNEASPIIDFYPTTFEIDMNGKRMAWQGVALLPFIDQSRLLDAVEPLYSQLTEEERKRNSWGNSELFVSDAHPLFNAMAKLYGRKSRNEVYPLDGKSSEGLSGSIRADDDYFPGMSYTSPLTGVGLQDIEDDKSIHALYLYPKQSIPHRSRLLPHVKVPPRRLTSADFQHVQRGGRGGGRVGDSYRRGDDRRYPGARPTDVRGYSYNYGGGGTNHHNSYTNANGWRSGSNSRGEPDYSYGGTGSTSGYQGFPGGYRPPPLRGMGRGRGGYASR